MSTTEHRTNFADKRNVPQTRLKDTFFDYLLLRLNEVTSRVWSGQRGIFGSTSLISGGNDRFSVSGPFPVDAVDGDGNILNLDTVDGELVFFENEVAIVYSVGMRHALIPSGVLRNPRIQVIHYDTDEDRIGEVAEPDAVVEVAGTLEIEVDSVFESGVSNAGRSVTVWLKRPRTIEDAVAIERNVTVVFSGGKNKVTTTGLLGQGSPASTNLADYQVAAQGLTVRRNTDLSVTDPYVFIGTVTGGGAGSPPSGFSVLGQIDVSDGINPDLQTAYVAGRTITPALASGGAVRIESADSGDPLRSLLVLDRKGATEASPLGLTLVNERGDGAALVQLTSIVHSDPATELIADEAGTTAAGVGVVNLTRGGVDLVVANVLAGADLVLLWDFSPTTAMNRLYRIASFAATQLTLTELDGTAPTWSGSETGNVSILRPRVSLAEPTAVSSHAGLAASLAVQGSNEVDSPAPVRWHPRKAASMAEFYDSLAAPRVQGEITRHGTFRGRTVGNVGTPYNELFRSSRFDNTDSFQTGFVAEMGDRKAVPFVAIQPQTDGAALLAQEDATLAGAVATLTRGSVDLTTSGLVHVHVNLVLVEESDDPDDDGIYSLTSFTGTTVTLSEPDGSAASFGGTAAKVRILLPRFSVANFLPMSTNAEMLPGTFFSLMDGDENKAPVSFFPVKSIASSLVIFYNRGDLVADPEICCVWGMLSDGSEFQPRWKFGDENGAGDPVHCGMEFVPHPGRDAEVCAINVNPLEPKSAAVESLYNRAVGWKNYEGDEVLRLEQGGRIARVSEFFDDFNYQSQPHGSIWTENVSGGSVFWDAGEDGTGIVRCTAAGAASFGGVERFGQHYMKHKTASPDIFRILNFVGRFRPLLAAPEDPDFLQMRAECYLGFVGSFKVGVMYDAVASNTGFRFFAYDGSTENITALKGLAGPDLEERGYFKFWMRLDLQSNLIDVSWQREETANSNGRDVLTFPTPASASWEGKGAVVARITSKNANTHGIEVDYLHVYDEIIKSGAKDRNS